MKLCPQSQRQKIPKAEIETLYNLLAELTVHHRVVEETSDFSNWQPLTIQQKDLVNSERHQVEINTKTQLQINRITDTLNTVIKTIKHTEIDTEHLFEILLSRTKMIISEL